MQMHQLSVGRYIESNGKLVTVHKMKCAFVAVSKTVHEVHWWISERSVLIFLVRYTSIFHVLKSIAEVH